VNETLIDLLMRVSEVKGRLHGLATQMGEDKVDVKERLERIDGRLTELQELIAEALPPGS